MKINIGCGNKSLDGFVGIDLFPCDAVDIISDISKYIPIRESTIDEVYASHVIEHIFDIVLLMKEIHRVCKSNAIVTIITPHFSSIDSWRDPTHIHHLTYYSMNHFEKRDTSHYTGGGFVVEDTKLSFGGGFFGLIGRFIFKISPKYYEKKWCFIFRASTITCRMRVIKR